MIPRLGVNIDHVATLRQARGEPYPSVVEAAAICLQEGADQITIHLREDRRHIQDTDVEAVRLVTKRYGKPLNLEMGCHPEIVDIAVATNPDWVCLVPENRAERTTEGGLNLCDEANFNRVAQSMKRLKEAGIKISLFLEASQDILKKAQELAPDAVEIHTGDYARAFIENEEIGVFLDHYREAKLFLEKNSIACHAGHGLTKESVLPLLKEGLFAEYNIGHWIISQAVFDGLSTVVRNLKKLFQGSQEN